MCPPGHRWDLFGDSRDVWASPRDPWGFIGRLFCFLSGAHWVGIVGRCHEKSPPASPRAPFRLAPLGLVTRIWH